MGQRLVVNIYGEDKELPLSNVYLHWSGFSVDSLDLTQGLLEIIEENDICLTGDIFKDKMQAFSLLRSIEDAKLAEDKSSFIDKVDIALLESLKKELRIVEEDNMIFEIDANRTDGLICFTKEGMESSIYELETKADIHLAKNLKDVRVSWNSLCKCDDEEEYQEMLECYNVSENEIEEITNIDMDALINGVVDVATFNHIKDTIYEKEVFRNKGNVYYMISSD